MLGNLAEIAARYGFTADMAPLAGLGLGALLVLWSLIGALTRKTPGADRLAALAENRREARLDRNLLKTPEATPGKVMQAFVPADAAKRSELQLKLAQAGFSGASAGRHRQ